MRGKYLSVFVGIFFLFLVFARGSLRDSTGNGFQFDPPKSQRESSRIKFLEIADSSGLSFFSDFWFPNPTLKASTLALISIYPSTSVYDVDEDGRPDILMTSPHPKTGIQLFLNRSTPEKVQFINATSEYGLGPDRLKPGVSRALFADFNHDGKIDLVVARFGCHENLLGQGPSKPFQPFPLALQGYCSNAVGLNVGDFDRDGYLDLFIADYWREDDLTNSVPRAPRLRSSRADQPGGKRVIFRGLGDGRFERTAWLDFLPRSYSNNAGIADINSDGWLDLYIANDYQHDFLVLNNQGTGFRDGTETWAPLAYHGLNGMNADFGDFNRDGRLDLYVSNISAPPFVAYNNVLWTNMGDRYEDQARDLGVAHCGWSWSAKWSDFDNDGQLDLVVANGRARGPGSEVNTARSVWHARALALDVPYFLRRIDPLLDYPNTHGRHLSGFARNCLFRQNDGKFWDVAEQSGLTDIEEGYGLALIDLDSDGRMDFTTSNLGGPAVLYHNRSPQSADVNWIGFKLEGTRKFRDPFGALVELNLSSGRKLVSLYYPTNGFNSQSDSRIHFGLSAKDGTPTSVEVTWPTPVGTSPQKQRFDQITPNTYNVLSQQVSGSQ